MKNLIKSIPRKLFKLKNKKSRSVSRSNNPSFGSATSSDSSQKEKSGLATPTSVLSSHDINIHWDTIENKNHDFVHAFKLMDRDGDGKITREELETLLRTGVGAEPLSEEEIKKMLSEIDSDGDGCISLEEFSLIGSAFEPPACDDEVRDTFDFFDADHNGKISADELYNVFRTIVGEERCTLEDCRRMIAGVDKNGDGFVCFDEFSLMMDQQLQGIF